MLESAGAVLPRAAPDPRLLDARLVGEAAERAVLSLPLPRNRVFEVLYNYVVVDEPVVHLMPLHFLPRSSRGAIEHDVLHSLGVAAKLEYARSRFIDEIVDVGGTEPASDVHRLHGALVDLVIARYSEVLQGRASGAFFQTLFSLYAHHSASVAVDKSWSRYTPGSPTEEEYSAQARARNGSFRASVDAVLLLCGASTETLRRARESWHLWVLGAQFYDDVLDVEEDFESTNLTWTVARTLADFDLDMAEDRRPGGEAFYEAALAGGALTETLTRAESCFRSAALLAEDEFPSWAALQRACITQTSRLRIDLQELAARIVRR